MSKRFGAAAAVPLTALALAAMAGPVASASRSAATQQRTIGLIVTGPGNPIAPEVESGGASAAAALGDALAVTEAHDPDAQASTIDSLIAQHVAAIAIDNEHTSAAVARALTRARSAGIPTLSFEDRYSGSLWVSPSSPVDYAHALADALASQMNQQGEFIIVPCAPAARIVGAWLKATKTYIRHRYPRMHRVAVVYGGTGNGPAGTLVLRPLLRAHPRLRGLIFLCPSEAYTGPPQLIRAHKLGKVFSAGNGGDCPPLYQLLGNSVRRGAAQMVCAGDPNHLGYLTVWAADHLARGNTFTPGTYDAGGPVGSVRYYSRDEELRLGQPLTITQANLDTYCCSE